jgi:hypothetical protein
MSGRLRETSALAPTDHAAAPLRSAINPRRLTSSLLKPKTAPYHIVERGTILRIAADFAAERPSWVKNGPIRIGRSRSTRPSERRFLHLLFWELISPILGASELALLAYNLTLEWITTLDAIEFARTSNESLCTVRRSLACRKLCVPFREYIVLPVGPGTFSPKGDRISIDVTNIRTVCRFYMQRIVLCYDSMNDVVT